VTDRLRVEGPGRSRAHADLETWIDAVDDLLAQVNSDDGTVPFSRRGVLVQRTEHV
jgi:hypothetical protein